MAANTWIMLGYSNEADATKDFVFATNGTWLPLTAGVLNGAYDANAALSTTNSEIIDGVANPAYDPAHPNIQYTSGTLNPAYDPASPHTIDNPKYFNGDPNNMNLAALYQDGEYTTPQVRDIQGQFQSRFTDRDVRMERATNQIFHPPI